MSDQRRIQLLPNAIADLSRSLGEARADVVSAIIGGGPLCSPDEATRAEAARQLIHLQVELHELVCAVVDDLEPVIGLEVEKPEKYPTTELPKYPIS